MARLQMEITLAVPGDVHRSSLESPMQNRCIGDRILGARRALETLWVPPTIGTRDPVTFGRVCLRWPFQFRRLLDDRNVDETSSPMVATNKRGAPERFQADGSLRSTQPNHRPVTSTVRRFRLRCRINESAMESWCATSVGNLVGAADNRGARFCQLRSRLFAMARSVP